MDIQTEKIELAKRLLDTDNKSIINAVKSIFKTFDEADDWEDLPEKVILDTEESIRQIDAGLGIPHNTARGNLQKMALGITWSPRALDNFHQIIEYLEENWHEQVVKDFVGRTEKLLLLIAKHPRIFKQISQQNSVREALITKHNFLIYKIYPDRVALLAVFDTRQHPRKKKIF